jgi:hypothetical protein
VIVKTYSVTNLAAKDAARRYSPAQVVAVAREVESGMAVGGGLPYLIGTGWAASNMLANSQF